MDGVKTIYYYLLPTIYFYDYYCILSTKEME